MKDLKTFIKKVLFFALFFALIDVVTSFAFRNRMIPFTNYNLFNYKIFKATLPDVKNLKIVSLGSSMNITNLNSQVIAETISDSYYNYGIQGRTLSDSFILMKSFIPTVNPKVLVISGNTVDFRRNTKDISLPPKLALKTYINTHGAFFMFAGLYLPKLLTRNIDKEYAKEIAENKGTQYDVETDSHGGIPLNLDSNKMTFKKANKINLEIIPESYKDLENIAKYASKKGIKFVYIQSPSIKNIYESNKFEILIHIAKCKEIVERNGGIFINGYEMMDQLNQETDYYDPYHMNEPGAKKYTRYACESMIAAGIKNYIGEEN